ASSYVHDEMAAEDIVSEAFTYYWDNRHKLLAEGNAQAYVLTMIKHKCLDYLRHQQVKQDMMENLPQLQVWELSTRITTLESFEPSEIYTDEIRKLVEQTLQLMSPQTRRIFEMSRFENLSHKEIALRLGMTTKGVEFHIAKVLKVLRVVLRDYLPSYLLLLL
ncbi:MAG: RNA polymerase sigma-70 factor, partial [Bacteroidaceae bacterium]